MDSTSEAASHGDTITPTRSLTLLNGSGDSSIAWSEENDAVMEKIIAKKMAEGVSFFIVRPKILGLIPAGKRKAKSVDDAMKGRAVSVRDRDFASVISDGTAHLVKRPEGGTHEGTITRDPKRAARSHTVAVGAMAGG